MDTQLLDIYSDYLICSFGLVTATGLSALLQGSLSDRGELLKQTYGPWMFGAMRLLAKLKGLRVVGVAGGADPGMSGTWLATSH